jgi:hypothetical protein
VARLEERNQQWFARDHVAATMTATMRLRLLRFAVAACGAAIVTGCSAQQSVPAVSQATSAAAYREVKRTTTWVFVSDPGTSQVYVYDLPKLALVEIVTGFSQPQGECSDNKGDVWVTDGKAKAIYKLLHSGKIVGKLSDTYGYPDGCTWNPKTGNLAVMNLLGTNSASGAVLVYHQASGTPNLYYNPKQYYYNFASYDGSGNLFFDGRNTEGKFVLSELAVNAGQAKTISVSGGRIYNPGMVEWDAASRELIVGDQNCENKTQSCIYRMTIAANRGTINGQTLLENASGGQVCDLIQGALWKKTVVGSNFNYCGSGPSSTNVWPYPAGGLPNSANHKNVSQPFGAAISSESGDDAQNASPDTLAKKVDLLYISDGNGEVTVYTYWQKTLVRELSGFTQPMGECVDKNNNVFITDYGAKEIVEYAHAGKKPIATIDDAPYAPYACSVDFTTGALAVANEAGGSGRGNVAVYAGASGTPKIYTDKKITNFQALGYDASGNLLASSGQATRLASFAWLPKNGAKLVDVTLPGPYNGFDWEGTDGVQWDGRYFVVDDYNLYRVSVISGQGYYIGQTQVQNGGGQGGPFWIYNIHPKKQGTQVVGPYGDFSYGDVEYWDYPNGGDPIAEISHGIDKPTAVTVSLGTIHE